MKFIGRRLWVVAWIVPLVPLAAAVAGPALSGPAFTVQYAEPEIMITISRPVGLNVVLELVCLRTGFECTIGASTQRILVGLGRVRGQPVDAIVQLLTLAKASVYSVGLIANPGRKPRLLVDARPPALTQTRGRPGGRSPVIGAAPQAGAGSQPQAAPAGSARSPVIGGAPPTPAGRTISPAEGRRMEEAVWARITQALRGEARGGPVGAPVPDRNGRPIIVPQRAPVLTGLPFPGPDGKALPLPGRRQEQRPPNPFGVRVP